MPNSDEQQPSLQELVQAIEAARDSMELGLGHDQRVTRLVEAILRKWPDLPQAEAVRIVRSIR